MINKIIKIYIKQIGLGATAKKKNDFDENLKSKFYPKWNLKKKSQNEEINYE